MQYLCDYLCDYCFDQSTIVIIVDVTKEVDHLFFCNKHYYQNADIAAQIDLIESKPESIKLTLNKYLKYQTII